MCREASFELGEVAQKRHQLPQGWGRLDAIHSEERTAAFALLFDRQVNSAVDQDRRKAGVGQ